MKEKTPSYEAFIESPIYPTEDSYKLLKCLSNIFPKAEWEVKEELVRGYTTSLRRFSEILKDANIRNTARDHLLRQSYEDRCEFVLSKQSSCGSRVNFFGGRQPLGGITVKLFSDSIEEVIEYLTIKGDNT
ncbi:MAG: hypothetical protein R6U17_03980 [Thermoplasmata archaeon]